MDFSNLFLVIKVWLGKVVFTSLQFFYLKMTAKNKRPSEPRRANKPLMEKRRRARINQSLAALKTLILDSAKADNTKHSKLEKADILELTVRHFQRHQSLDLKGINLYKSGYADCVKEVQRYLETPDAQTMTVMDSGVRQRLLRHLDSCVAEVDMDIRQSSMNSPSIEEIVQPPDSSTLEEINNNTNPIQHLEGKEDESSSTKQMPKTYDGNFVLLLPEHYVQLASALGVNLRAHNEDLSNASTSNCEQSRDNKRLDKPLDYSGKNNDGNENMWRPW